MDGLKCTHHYYEWNDNLEERTTHLRFNEIVQKKIQQIENEVNTYLIRIYKTTSLSCELISCAERKLDEENIQMHSVYP